MKLSKSWEHFKYSEFRCKKLLKNGKFKTCSHCSGTNETKTELISLLDLVRSLAGITMIVNSGFRCKKRNKDAGGSPYSEHMSGEGADIRCTNSGARYKLIAAALSVGFNRIGVYPTFIHLGISKIRPQEVIW